MSKVKPKRTPSKDGGSLLNFFTKSNDTPAKRKRSTTISQVDVKPDVTTPASRARKGSTFVVDKGKSVDRGCGNQGNPVVISDDDEDEGVILPETKGGEKRKRSSPGIMQPERKGSSRCASREPEFILPPPIESLPDFMPPPTWPSIVNTAAGPDEYDVEVDGEEEGGEDGEGYNRDPDGDGSQLAVDDEDEVDEDEVEAEEIPDHVQEEIPDVTGNDPDRQAVLSDDGVQVTRGAEPPLDLGLVWDEGDDEGMGMEEDEDDGMEGGPEIIETPPLSTNKGKSGGKGKVEKVGECPVCGLSLKGKPSNMVLKHINTCLDAPSSSKNKTPSKSRASRPISSFSLDHASTFSPATSPSPPPEKGPNAFSVLMSGHKEREQWKDVEIDLKRDGKRIMGRRKAPFYKVLTGMPVAVDAFRYGAIPKVKAYLLTHAHSDHYTNLSKSWTHGPIYCSITTANLIIHMLGVEPQWVHGLPDNIPFEMPGTGGVKVTPIEANHCPGSSIFLFEGPQTVNGGDSAIKSPYVGSKRIFRYLHCGDFRACPKHVLHPAVARARIDTCYLDTTYLNPKYCFPPQPQVIEACALLARKIAVGISPNAPSIEDLKPEIKPFITVKAEGAGGGGYTDDDAGPGIAVDMGEDVDVKPDFGIAVDRHALEEEREEKSKAMMQGWLVKRDSGVGTEGDVKADGDVKVKMEDGGEGGEGGLREVKKEEKVKPKGRTLIVMGTYSIGKERIVKAVAKALGTTIYCDPRKRGILLCQTDDELHGLMSTDPIASQVHLLPLGNIQLDQLQPYLARLHPHFDRVLGFRPTGWSYSPPAGTDMMPDINLVIRRDQGRWFSDAGLKAMRGSCRQFMMYGVPYSEHSSFFELTCFALSMPGPDLKMIATVNVGNEKSRAKMKKWFEKWLAEKAKRREKKLPQIVDYRDETYW